MGGGGGTWARRVDKFPPDNFQKKYFCGGEREDGGRGGNNGRLRVVVVCLFTIVRKSFIRLQDSLLRYAARCTPLRLLPPPSLGCDSSDLSEVFSFFFFNDLMMISIFFSFLCFARGPRPHAIYVDAVKCLSSCNADWSTCHCTR